MAKQNRDKSFADATQQNRKSAEIVPHEAGKKRKRRRRRRLDRKKLFNIIIWLIPLGLIIAVICYYNYLSAWSEGLNKGGEYLDFIAENMMNAVMLIAEILSLLGTVFFVCKKENKFACVAVTAAVFVMLYGLLAAKMKVDASVASDKELFRASIENAAYALNAVNMQEILQLRQYIPEDDIFMESLEQYRRIPEDSISREERLEIMAEIILSYLKSQNSDTSAGKFPNSYEENVLSANIKYEAFLWYKERGEQPENNSIKDMIDASGLTDLCEAIEYRVKADNAHPDAENRRLAAVYYIDEGDLRQNEGETGEAAVCYENAAEWAIKSIVSAAAVNDVEAMEEAWNVLDSAADLLEAIEESDESENVRKVTTIREAYELVIGQW